MARKAMISRSDSPNPSALLNCSSDERPPVFITPAGYEELREAERLPMDALPQIEVKAAPPVGDDYGGF